MASEKFGQSYVCDLDQEQSSDSPFYELDANKGSNSADHNVTTSSDALVNRDDDSDDNDLKILPTDHPDIVKAKKTISEERITLVVKRGSFLIEDAENFSFHTVTLYPEETCSCPVSNVRCWHVMACWLSMGIPLTELFRLRQVDVPTPSDGSSDDDSEDEDDSDFNDGDENAAEQ